jgi:hypothetical protein
MEQDGSIKTYLALTRFIDFETPPSSRLTIAALGAVGKGSEKLPRGTIDSARPRGRLRRIGRGKIP